MSDAIAWRQVVSNAVPAHPDFWCSLLPDDFDSRRLSVNPEGFDLSVDEYKISDHLICPLSKIDGGMLGVALVPPNITQRVRYLPERFPSGSYVLGKPAHQLPVCIVRDLADALALSHVGVPCVHVAFDDDNVFKVARDCVKSYGSALIVTHTDYPPEKDSKPQLSNIDRISKMANVYVISRDLAVNMVTPPTAQALYAEIDLKLEEPSKLPSPLANAVQSEMLKGAFSKWTTDTMCEEISLIYTTDTVWDNRNHVQMRLSALRHVVGNDMFKLWQDHSARKIVKGLEFEPSGDVKFDYVNLFFGLPARIETPPENCKLILDHIKRLCGGRGGEFEWLLKWVAYPLQNLGAKMDSGVIMYGSEGPGKSILWEYVIGQIYGEYAITIGQAQLESQFNGWMSRKMFALCEEVVSRSERNQHKGQLKHMITGKTIQINDKNLPLREEQNHVNSVFLSNSTVPLELDVGDRRYLVLYCGDVPTQQYFTDLFEEIKTDGVDAFYHYLMKIDLTGFSEHTRPPLNEDKERLIEASMSSPVLFFSEWKRGDTDYPYTSCTKFDLFTAYKRWCVQRNEFPKRDRDVTAELGRHMKNDKKDICFPSVTSVRKSTRIWITHEDFLHCPDSDFVGRLAKNCRTFNESITKQSDKSRFGDD